MNTNLPKREPRKPKMAPIKRLQRAVNSLQMRAFDRALADCVACPGGGDWPHRALRLIMDVHEDEGGRYFLDQLMACGKPPKPSSTENFLGFAVMDERRHWVVPTLIDAGFKIKAATVDGGRPLDRLAALVCDGKMGQCLPLLARVIRIEQFQRGLGAGMKRALMDDRQGRGVLSPDAARLIAEGFCTLSDERASGLAQRMSEGFGRAILASSARPDGEALREDGWPQRHASYKILRDCGALELQGILEGIGEGEAGAKVRAMGLLGRFESVMVAQDMHANTPPADQAPRIVRM